MAKRYPASLILLFLASIIAARTASAQIDISGLWANKRAFENNSEEAAVGDYAGTPINDAARMRADSWSASILTVPEHQCDPHGVDRIDNFTNMRIWQEEDRESHKLIAYHIRVETWGGLQRDIWMDGRPEPPEYALHSFWGFSTGHYDGNILTVTTTHLKEGWLKRAGIQRSEKGTVIEHFIRHGEWLELVVMAFDPAYLTEPFIHSTSYKFDPTIPTFIRYPCEPAEEIVRPDGQIPSHLPGTNDQLTEWATKFGIPQEAARGGAETMYPEYVDKLKQWIKKPGATPR